MKRDFVTDEKNFIIHESKYKNPALKSFPFANDSTIYFHPIMSLFGIYLNVLLFHFFSTGLFNTIKSGDISSIVIQCLILLMSISAILFFGYNGLLVPLWLLIWRICYHILKKKNKIATSRFRMKNDFICISFTSSGGWTFPCPLGFRTTILYQDVPKPTVYLRNCVVIIPSHLYSDYIQKMLDDFFLMTDPY